jgi:hypothetical protein
MFIFSTNKKSLSIKNKSLETKILHLHLKLNLTVFHFVAILHLLLEQIRSGQAQLNLMKPQNVAQPYLLVCYRSGSHESFNDCTSSGIMHFLHALCPGMPRLVHNSASAFGT